jgi:hypothetical protein
MNFRTVFHRIEWFMNWLIAVCFAYMYGQLAFIVVAAVLVFPMHWLGVMKHSFLYTVAIIIAELAMLAVTVWATPKVYRRQRRGLWI